MHTLAPSQPPVLNTGDGNATPPELGADFLKELRDLKPIRNLHPSRHIWRARKHAMLPPPSCIRDIHSLELRSQCTSASSSQPRNADEDESSAHREPSCSGPPPTFDDKPNESGEALAMEFAALTQRSPHRVFANEGYCANSDDETRARLAGISELDVPVLCRGRDNDQLRSRDVDSTTFLLRVNPLHLWFQPTEHAAPTETSGLAKLHAEVRKLHDTVYREMAQPSGRRTVRFLGREMYLPSMAPTADDPIDVELLEYLWDISGEPGEGRPDGFPAAPH
jgi:hypothetical protein